MLTLIIQNTSAVIWLKMWHLHLGSRWTFVSRSKLSTAKFEPLDCPLVCSVLEEKPNSLKNVYNIGPDIKMLLFYSESGFANLHHADAKISAGPIFTKFLSCRFNLLLFQNFQRYDARIFCQLTLLTTWHFINLHFMKLLFHQLVVSSTCHFTSSLFHQLALLSTWHFINLLFHQLDISLSCSFINLLFHQLDI